MPLRKELRPDIRTAQICYPIVYALISDYDTACDIGRVQDAASAIQKIGQVTGRQIDETALVEYWGWISKEDLAFRLALPQARWVPDFFRAELIEVFKSADFYEDKYLGFYQELLECNFPHPAPMEVIFNTNASVEQMADTIIYYRPIQL